MLITIRPCDAFSPVTGISKRDIKLPQRIAAVVERTLKTVKKETGRIKVVRQGHLKPPRNPHGQLRSQ